MLPKCCPAIKEKFLFRKFFSKTHFNVSKSKKVIFAAGGGVYLDMNYVFASYMKKHLFLMSGIHVSIYLVFLPFELNMLLEVMLNGSIFFCVIMHGEQSPFFFFCFDTALKDSYSKLLFLFF